MGEGPLAPPLAPEEFVQRLRTIGAKYHDRHRFHERMNAGSLSREDLKTWAVNRYYYQRSIPLKDAAILSNCPDREVRRRWVKRILDHDGVQGSEGGIEAWLRLCFAVGATREEVESETLVVPGVRFAVDAYLTLARTRPWIRARSNSAVAPTISTQSAKPVWTLLFISELIWRIRVPVWPVRCKSASPPETLRNHEVH